MPGGGRRAVVIGADATAERALADRGESFVTVGTDRERWVQELGGEDLVVIDGPHLGEAVADIRAAGGRAAVIDDAGGAHPDAQVVVCADRTASLDRVRDGPAAPGRARPRPGSPGVPGPPRAGVEPPTEVLTVLGGTDPGVTWRTWPGRGRPPAGPTGPPPALGRRGCRWRRRRARGRRIGRVRRGNVGLGAALCRCARRPWSWPREDQYDPARIIADAGAALVLGTIDDALATGFVGVEALTDPEERRRLVEAGLDLVDGRGPERVLDALLAS